MPQLRLQRWSWFAVLATLILATAIDGATLHLPALLLRLLVAVGAVLIWPRGAVTLPRRTLWAPALAITAVLLGTLRTPDPAPAAQAAATALAVCLLFFALLAAGRSTTTRALTVFVGAGLAHAAWAAGQWMTGTTVAGRASAGFFNPNDLAAFLAPAVLLALDAALAGRLPGRAIGSLRGYLGWGAVLVLLIALLATGSRSGTLAVLVGGGLLLLRPSRHRRTVAAGLVVAGLASLLLFGWRWSGRDDPYALARLTHIWPRSIELALSEPLGVGLSGYADGMRVFGIPFDADVRYPRQASNAHSELLNAWVELGWLGLLAVLAAVATPLGALLHRWTDPPEEDFDRFTHWGVLVAFAVPASVSASMHVPPVALFATVWAAHVVLTYPTEAPRVSLGPHGRSRFIVGFVGAASLLIALPGSVAATLTQRAAMLRDAGETEAALDVAAWAERVAPHSLGAALMAESLRHARGAPKGEVIAHLLDLAEAFPEAPEPIDRALRVARSMAFASDAPDAWRGVVVLAAELSRRDPLDARHHVARGEALLRLNDPTGATTAFRAALAVEPHCADALARLALLLPPPNALGAELAARAWAANNAGVGRKFASTRILSLRPDLAKMLQATYPREQ